MRVNHLFARRDPCRQYLRTSPGQYVSSRLRVWPGSCLRRIRQRFLQGTQKEDELLTNDWWGLNEGDDLAAREKRRPKQVDMRNGVELRTCYITTRDGVKVCPPAF